MRSGPVFHAVGRVTRGFVIGFVVAVLGFHTLFLGAALLVLGTERVLLFGLLAAGTGAILVAVGLWRAVAIWRSSPDRVSE